MAPRVARDSALALLSDHHQRALALAVLIDRKLKGAPAAAQVDELAEQVVRFAEENLFSHLEITEALVFPSLQRLLDSSQLIDGLLADHEALRSCVGSLAAAQGERRASLLKGFGELLRRHIHTEERSVFATLRTRLDDSRREELGRRIAEALRARRA